MTVALKQTAEVTQQIGQELFIRAKNSGASTILNGTVVYITGSDVGNPVINSARASENDGGKVTKVIGIATEDITAGETGFVTTVGVVRNINTSGFTAGDTVYLSTTDYGKLTATKPSYPDFVIEIGVITSVDSTDGEVLVKVSNLSQIANIRGVEEVGAGGTPFTATTRSDVILAAGTGIYYLPESPLTGQTITIIDKDGDAENANIVIDGNGKLISGENQARINTDYGSLTFIYTGSNWFATAFTP